MPQGVILCRTVSRELRIKLCQLFVELPHPDQHLQDHNTMSKTALDSDIYGGECMLLYITLG